MMAEGIKGRMAGVWELVKANFETPDGNKFEPWGPSPTGIAIITADGHYSAQIMRSGRAKFAGDLPTQEEKQKAYDDYMAYYGYNISIDEETGTSTNFVEGATNANWVGGEQVRYCEMKDDDHMILRTPPFEIARLKLVGTLSWKRRR